MDRLICLMAVIVSGTRPVHGTGLFGQTRLFNFSTGNESFLIKGTLGAPLTSIFCWREKLATLGRFWESVVIEIVAEENDDLKIHLEKTVEIVQEDAANDAVFWFQSSASLVKGKTLRISPFKRACIGVTTSETYHVICNHRNVDPGLLVLSLAGLALYCGSNDLARIRPLESISLAIIHSACYLWSCWFLLQVTALFSGSYFLYSYLTRRMISPWTEKRSTKSIASLLRMMSLLLIWNSSYNQVASSLLSACLFVLSSPFSTKTAPAVQPSQTTAQALRELRSYCQSSDLNVWKLVSKLQKPQTFANFMETGQHISCEERENYRQVLETGEFQSILDTSGEISRDISLYYGHRFTCHVCNERLLGHRFHCAHCYIGIT